MTTTADTAELLRLFFIQRYAVNLPGIGGFRLNRIPAQADPESGSIVAPSYIIVYDALNDVPQKDMFAYIAEKKDITEWEAIGVVNQFSQELKDTLRNGQKFEWDGIGSLENNDAGQLVFDPVTMRYPFYPSMKGVYEWRKYREPETHGNYAMPVAEMEVGEETVVEARASWWIWAAVIAAVSLMLIFFNLVRNEYRFSSARDTKFTPSAMPVQYQNKPADR
jgi:hypothetical protein